MRKRVLFPNEASFLSTGFATYGLELLKRLHASGKYELLELAAYAHTGDPRAAATPWRFKGVLPREEERAAYDANPLNQFGEWKFEEACLEFRPDVVLGIRDWWHDEFVERSPFRPHYRWLLMPTVDAEPQDEQWLATFLDADRVFSYSDWGLDLLKRQSGGRIRTVCSAPPGADLESFRVQQDPRRHKEAMGLDPDCLLVGTVMRNQRRKLYPEFLDAFALFLREAPRDLADRTYLYLHTAWPDVGWDIPRLLRESGLCAKTLFTYHCRACGAAFPAFFMDSRAFCRGCGRYEATFPNTQTGVSRKTLSDILGLFDVYVQYANCLSAGTEVLLGRGWTPIEDVRQGDLAYTHNGNWRPVLRTFRHTAGDRPLELNFCGENDSLTITSEHPVYAIAAENIRLIHGTSVRETLGQRIRNRQQVPGPDFVPAGRLAAGDMVAYRIDDTVEDIETVDLVATAMADWCRKGESKRLPAWSEKLPVGKQEEILRGLFMGDGHYLESRKVSIYVTTSSAMASQVKTMLRRCRCYYNVRLVRKGGNRRDQYRFEVAGDIASGEFTLSRKRSSTGSLYQGSFLLLKIKSVVASTYSGEVFNFEVAEDNSYATRTCIVHNCEGFGMPQVEAAACGLHVMATDYSAMSDVVRKLKGTPIQVLTLYREPETHCKRAIPDPNDFVRGLTAFLSLPEAVRRKKGYEARRAVEEHYTWDATAAKWMEAIDAAEPALDWGSPPRIHAIARTPPEGLTNEEFVRWGMCEVAGRPELANSYTALRMVRDLNWGSTMGYGMGGQYFNEASTLGSQQRFSDFGRAEAYRAMADIGARKNHWEALRASGGRR